MRKKLLLMFAVAVMFTVSAIGQVVTIPNGDMNAWADASGLSDGYSRSGTNSLTQVHMSQAEGRGGSGYATKFQTTGYTSNGSNRFFTPKFALSKAGTYKVTFWVKGVGRLSFVRMVDANRTDKTSTVYLAGATYSIGDANVLINENDWKKMEYEFTGEKGLFQLCFMFNKEASGSDTDILLDDISLELVIPSVSLVQNFDMNTWDAGVEIDSATIPTGYARSGTSNYFYKADGRGVSGSPDYATRIITTSTSNSTNRFFTTQFMLPQMGKYKISFWVKGSAQIDYVKLTPKNSSADGDYIGGRNEEINTADWQLIEREFMSFTAGLYYFCFTIHASTASPNADMLLDDISIEFLSSNIVDNGNMSVWSETAGVPNLVPDGYVVGSGVRQDTVFSRLEPGRGGDGYALGIKNGPGSNRLRSAAFSLDSTKTYKLSFWLKGTGTIDWTRLSATSNPTSTTNSVVLTGEPSGTFDYADWTEVTRVFIPKNTRGYHVFLSIINSNCYIDDISLIEYPSNDALLKNLSIPDLGNESTASYDFVLPGFTSNNENYTIPLWFGATTVPDLKVVNNHSFATYEIDNGGSNSFASGAIAKIVKVIARAEDLSTTKTYTVTFDRTDFIAGFPNNFSTATSPFAQTLPGFRTASKSYSHGDYWGASTYRPNSNTGGELITHKLVNGAGTVTFWTGTRSANYPTQSGSIPAAGPNDKMLIKVSYTIDGGTSWTNVDSIQVDTTALHGQWTQVSYDIKKSDPNTQVKFEYIRMDDAPRYLPIDIDDIRITPWLGTDIPEIKIKPFVALNIYPQGQTIVVAEEGRYMIYTASGQLIASGNNTDQIITIPVKSGLYIAKSGDQAKKLVVK